MEQFVETFDRQSSVFVETLSKYGQKDKVEMFPLVTLCALDVICESAMGTQINAQQNSNSDYVLAVKKYLVLAPILYLTIIMSLKSFTEFRTLFILECSTSFLGRTSCFDSVHCTTNKKAH